MPTKRTGLIVNADDFGLTEPINRGIMQAIREGIVTSVSVAANGRYLAEACQFLQENPKISVGWHVNLTGGYPVLPPDSVRSLVNKNGRFHGKIQFLFRLVTGRINYRQCRNELVAQYNRLKNTGIAITHVDSHHDIHCIPLVAEILQQVLDEKTTFRYRQGVIQSFNSRLLTSIHRMLVKFLVPATNENRNKIDYIWFRELYQYPDKLNIVKSCIRKMHNGINLLICHPGYFDTVNELHLQYNSERQKELAALCNHDLLDLINQMNIELISWHRIGHEAYV